jgi:hypothetical protein
VTYRVVWHLVGRGRRPLDTGCLDAEYPSYAEAAAAVNELLRPYPDVRHDEEGCWAARRSADADLVVEVWIERLHRAAEDAARPDALVVDA